MTREQHHGDRQRTAPSRRFHFAGYTFDPGTGELCREGETVALAPQPAKVLTTLLGRAGEVVARESLYEEVWGDDVHVDYQQGLHYCVRQVRIALGEDARKPRFIETLPRRGYRFLVRPTVVETSPASGNHGGTGSPGGEPGRDFLRWPLGVALAAGAGTLAVMISLGIGLFALGPEGAGTEWWPRTGSGETRSARLGDESVLEAYMAGRYLAAKEEPELERAIREYERAVRAEPGFAPAHAGLAEAYWKLTSRGALEPESGYSRALAAAERALELGDDGVEAHLARGIARLYRDLDWPAAAAAFDQARRAAPEDARAWFWHARALAATGAHAAAERAAERALLLDPESRQIMADLGWFHMMSGRYEDAVMQCRRALELEPRSIPAAQCLVGAHLRLGDREAAMTAAREVLEMFADHGVRSTPTPRPRSSAGWLRAAGWLAEICPANSFASSRALMYTLAGDDDAAIEQLEFAVEHRHGWAPFIPLDPTFASLGGRSRFRQLTERVVVPPAGIGN